MSDTKDRHELFDRHLRGELSDPEMERLAEQLDSDSSSRKDFVEYAQWDTRFAEALREDRGSFDDPNNAESADALLAAESEMVRERRLSMPFARTLLAIAAVVIVALAASLYFQQSIAEHGIAKITGLGGSLVWTGDGGRIVRDLSIKTELSGGTIEGVAPDSWFELTFNDGSTVAISGNSMLTFSESNQKILLLKEGNLSANVKPQPPGKPMLIHTRSAILEVLGTQFEIEAGLSATMLNVSEGKVRVKRLSDGSSVDVSAKHRVVAAADREMSPVRVPDSVRRWKSQLYRGSDRTYGKWLPATDQHAARLKGIPLVPSDYPSDTLLMLGLPVSSSDSSPVILHPNSRFILRGRIASARGIYFGIKMAHPNGAFAGKFRAEKSASGFNDLRDFEAVFRLSDFELDPCVRDRKEELPGNPEGLIVTGVYCFTPHRTGDAMSMRTVSLEVTEVELLPPDENELK